MPAHTTQPPIVVWEPHNIADLYRLLAALTGTGYIPTATITTPTSTYPNVPIVGVGMVAGELTLDLGAGLLKLRKIRTFTIHSLTA